jgi:hypothetical protein
LVRAYAVANHLPFPSAIGGLRHELGRLAPGQARLACDGPDTQRIADVTLAW